jgi:hypothetical protein
VATTITQPKRESDEPGGRAGRTVKDRFLPATPPSSLPNPDEHDAERCGGDESDEAD